MFKFFVLFAVVAAAFAKPQIPIAYNVATPIVSSYPAVGAVYPAAYPYAAPIHTIAKREALTPLAYSGYPAYTPVIGAYPKPIVSAYSAPWVHHW